MSHVLQGVRSQIGLVCHNFCLPPDSHTSHTSTRSLFPCVIESDVVLDVVARATITALLGTSERPRVCSGRIGVSSTRHAGKQTSAEQSDTIHQRLMPKKSTHSPSGSSFFPPNDQATYRDLLLFEERLKTHALTLNRRKSRYQCAFHLLLTKLTDKALCTQSFLLN